MANNLPNSTGNGRAGGTGGPSGSGNKSPFGGGSNQGPSGSGNNSPFVNVPNPLKIETTQGTKDYKPNYVPTKDGLNTNLRFKPKGLSDMAAAYQDTDEEGNNTAQPLTRKIQLDIQNIFASHLIGQRYSKGARAFELTSQLIPTRFSEEEQPAAAEYLNSHGDDIVYNVFAGDHDNQLNLYAEVFQTAEEEIRKAQNWQYILVNLDNPQAKNNLIIESVFQALKKSLWFGANLPIPGDVIQSFALEMYSHEGRKLMDEAFIYVAKQEKLDRDRQVAAYNQAVGEANKANRANIDSNGDEDPYQKEAGGPAQSTNPIDASTAAMNLELAAASAAAATAPPIDKKLDLELDSESGIGETARGMYGVVESDTGQSSETNNRLPDHDPSESIGPTNTNTARDLDGSGQNAPGENSADNANEGGQNPQEDEPNGIDENGANGQDSDQNNETQSDTSANTGDNLDGDVAPENAGSEEAEPSETDPEEAEPDENEEDSDQDPESLNSLTDDAENKDTGENVRDDGKGEEKKGDAQPEDGAPDEGKSSDDSKPPTEGEDSEKNPDNNANKEGTKKTDGGEKPDKKRDEILPMPAGSGENPNAKLPLGPDGANPQGVQPKSNTSTKTGGKPSALTPQSGAPSKTGGGFSDAANKANALRNATKDPKGTAKELAKKELEKRAKQEVAKRLVQPLMRAAGQAVASAVAAIAPYALPIIAGIAIGVIIFVVVFIAVPLAAYCIPIPKLRAVFDAASAVTNASQGNTIEAAKNVVGKGQNPFRAIAEAAGCKDDEACNTDGSSIVGDGSVDFGNGAAGTTCAAAPRTGIMARPEVRALSRALKFTESTNNYTVTNNLGCYGAYQFCPFGSWEEATKEYNSNPSLYGNSWPSSIQAATPVQQDYAFAAYFNRRIPGGFDDLKAAGTNANRISQIMDEGNWCGGWTPFGDERTGGCAGPGGENQAKRSKIISIYLAVIQEEISGKCGQNVNEVEDLNNANNNVAWVIPSFINLVNKQAAFMGGISQLTFGSVSVEAQFSADEQADRQRLAKLMEDGSISAQDPSDIPNVLNGGFDDNLVDVMLTLYDSGYTFRTGSNNGPARGDGGHGAGEAMDFVAFQKGSRFDPGVAAYVDQVNFNEQTKQTVTEAVNILKSTGAIIPGQLIGPNLLKAEGVVAMNTADVGSNHENHIHIQADTLVAYEDGELNGAGGAGSKVGSSAGKCGCLNTGSASASATASTAFVLPKQFNIFKPITAHAQSQPQYIIMHVTGSDSAGQKGADQSSFSYNNVIDRSGKLLDTEDTNSPFGPGTFGPQARIYQINEDGKPELDGSGNPILVAQDIKSITRDISLAATTSGEINNSQIKPTASFIVKHGVPPRGVLTHMAVQMASRTQDHPFINKDGTVNPKLVELVKEVRAQGQWNSGDLKGLTNEEIARQITINNLAMAEASAIATQKKLYGIDWDGSNALDSSVSGLASELGIVSSARDKLAQGGVQLAGGLYTSGSGNSCPVGTGSSFGAVATGSELTEGPFTSFFGPRDLGYHYGVDIGCTTGKPIFAFADGKVSQNFFEAGGYGNVVYIDHGNGKETRYGHMNQPGIALGTNVKKGQQVGVCGSTGRSTGPHLHFEIRLNGTAVDPCQNGLVCA